ncbi:hypothetical protein ES705_11133 [subsurface metagenome]
MVKKSLRSYEFTDLFFQKKREEELEEREKKIERSLEMREIFNVDYFFENKENWLLGLFEKIDEYCLNVKRGVEKEFRKSYIRWSYSGIMFCRIFVFQNNLKLYLKLRYEEIEQAPAFIRDYSDRVRGIKTIEITLDEKFLENQEAYFAVVSFLIRKSFSEVTGTKKLEPVKKRELKPVKPTENFRSSLNLMANGNGYIDVSFKIKKEQRELLSRILSETILKE